MIKQGFTLAELLIALAILGVIATFTIPKVLQAQQNGAWNSEAKEVAGMISGAYSAYQQANTPTANTTFGDVTQYLNYIAADTTSTIDQWQNNTTRPCNSGWTCVKLHNGGMLNWNTTTQFGGTGSTNAMPVTFDPDGRVTDGTTNGPGKSVQFFIYYNGYITSRGYTKPNTVSSTNLYASPVPSDDPPWFSWN